jgi:hypothetical protein
MDRSQREIYCVSKCDHPDRTGEEDAFQQELNEVREQIEQAGLPEEAKRRR